MAYLRTVLMFVIVQLQKILQTECAVGLCILMVNQFLISHILLQWSVAYRHQTERERNLSNAWHIMLKSTKKTNAGSIPASVIGIFHCHISSEPHCDPGVDSASSRNEYQHYFLRDEGGRCVGLTTLSHSCADCLEICEPKTPGTLGVCPGV